MVSVQDTKTDVLFRCGRNKRILVGRAHNPHSWNFTSHGVSQDIILMLSCILHSSVLKPQDTSKNFGHDYLDNGNNGRIRPREARSNFYAC